MNLYEMLALTLLSLCLPMVILGQGEVEDKANAVDCHDQKHLHGKYTDDEYYIYPYPSDGDPRDATRVKTFCEGMGLESDEVWTVIQRHQDASNPLFFDQPWDLYKRGFGARSGDFWIGNEFLYRLTKGRKYVLRVEIETWDTQPLRRHADYADFRVGSEDDKYTLHVGNYTGDAGDALKYHNGMKFTTKDQDNDAWYKRCSDMLSGGWWFKNCAHSNLNGQAYQGKWTGLDKDYRGGVWWLPMHPTENDYDYYFKYSVKSVMKIKREDFVPQGVIA